MEKAGVEPNRNKVQLCAIDGRKIFNSRSDQKDNSELFKKVLLRSRFASDLKKVDIFLAACGRGQMLRHIWRKKANYVLALDIDQGKIEDVRYYFPDIDARVADINVFSDWPVNVEFQIADFDVYGSPYQAVLNFLESAHWKTPLYVFVTDGLPLWIGRGGYLPSVFTGETMPAKIKGSEAKKYYLESIVFPWWHDMARKKNLKIAQSVTLWKKGKTVAYYGIKLISNL